MKKIITLIAFAIFGFSFSQTTVIYQNYRNSIVSVNWNALGVELNLTPSQRNAITVLNNRYPTYESWYVVYKDRPGYWERDRDRELRRILGSTSYVKYKNKYYKGNNPNAVYNRNKGNNGHNGNKKHHGHKK